MYLFQVVFLYTLWYNLVMPLTIKIPTGKEKKEYSLYVNGKITYKHTEPTWGTLLVIKGSGIAFYSASNSRRAIIFQELSENSFLIPLEEGNLPYIKQKVRVLYKAKGRKVDLLKFLIYQLEIKYKDDIYELGTLYWLYLGSYIDSISNKKNGSKKRQIFTITEKYIKMRKRLYENFQRHS